MRFRCLVLTLLLLTGSALAQQESLRQFLKRALPNANCYNIKVQDDWALCQVAYGTEGEGMALVHRYGSGWEMATSGGGAMGATELALFGVPDYNWAGLLGHPLSQADHQGARTVLAEPYWTWLTSKRQVKDSDLEGYSALELTLMRNEVFALHGRPFTDPYLRATFSTRPWYKTVANFSEAKLTPLQRANVTTIMNYQRRTGKL